MWASRRRTPPPAAALAASLLFLAALPSLCGCRSTTGGSDGGNFAWLRGGGKDRDREVTVSTDPLTDRRTDADNRRPGRSAGGGPPVRNADTGTKRKGAAAPASARGASPEERFRLLRERLEKIGATFICDRDGDRYKALCEVTDPDDPEKGEVFTVADKDEYQALLAVTVAAEQWLDERR